MSFVCVHVCFLFVQLCVLVQAVLVMEGSLQLVTLLETLPHTLATLGLNSLDMQWPLVHKPRVEAVPHSYQLHQFVMVSCFFFFTMKPLNGLQCPQKKTCSYVL